MPGTRKPSIAGPPSGPTRITSAFATDPPSSDGRVSSRHGPAAFVPPAITYAAWTWSPEQAGLVVDLQTGERAEDRPDVPIRGSVAGSDPRHVAEPPVLETEVPTRTARSVVGRRPLVDRDRPRRIVLRPFAEDVAHDETHAVRREVAAAHLGPEARVEVRQLDDLETRRCPAAVEVGSALGVDQADEVEIAGTGDRDGGDRRRAFVHLVPGPRIVDRRRLPISPGIDRLKRAHRADDDREDRQSADERGAQLAATATLPHDLGQLRRHTADRARLPLEEVAQVAFDVIHASSPLIRSRSDSPPRATNDFTAATEHPSTSAVSRSDRSS